MLCIHFSYQLQLNKSRMIKESSVYWEGITLLELGLFMGIWHHMRIKRIHVYYGLTLMRISIPSNLQNPDQCMECQWVFISKKFTTRIRILSIWNGLSQRKTAEYKVDILVKLKHYAFTAFGEKVPVQLTPLLMPILKIAHVIW